jgi:hypothetical protein
VAWIRTGHPEIGHPQGLGYRSLLAEVRQRDNDACDLVAVLAKQRGALLGFFASLYRPILALFGAQTDGFVSGLFHRGNHLLATGLCQVIRKEPAITDYDSEP